MLKQLNSILTFCHQLAGQRESSVHARDSFTQNINLLRTTHEEEKEAWKAENESLRREHAQTKQQLSTLEKEHDACENKLAVSTVKLANAEEKCNHLEANLTAVTE